MDTNFDVDAAIAEADAPKKPKGWPKGVKRGPTRPAARAPEREVIRAEERAPEREPPRLVRKRKGNEADQFFIDPSDIPHGMDWNWKRTEVMGKDMEDFHQQGLAENGWSPVDAAKHRNYSSKTSGAITRPGYVLMERPKYLTQEAEAEVRQTALDYERQKKEELFLADNVVRKGSSVSKSFGPIDVPE